MIFRLILFLVVNFAALALGGLFTSKGVSSDWYAGLAKAPWTPPGWMFGAAWTVIMILFAFYLSYAWEAVENKKILLGLFIFQWILNVSWNPIFFYYQNAALGLIVITVLTFLVAYFLLNYWSILSFKSLLILPYFIWLLIATSLNAYIYFKN